MYRVEDPQCHFKVRMQSGWGGIVASVLSYKSMLLTSQDVRFYSHTICPLLPFQNKVSFFLTGPNQPLAALVLGRRFHPPERQRVAVCPRFAPSGGNGKGGEPKSLLPQAESGASHAARVFEIALPRRLKRATICGP